MLSRIPALEVDQPAENLAGDETWMQILLENKVDDEQFDTAVSGLVGYLQSVYRFQADTGTQADHTIKRIVEDLLRGATLVIAWVLTGFDKPDSPIIIHEKNATFQVVKVISNILMGMGLPADNIVFVRDRNMEKQPSSSYHTQLFNQPRKFLNGSVSKIGEPTTDTRIIIALNYFFEGWNEKDYLHIIANYLQIFQHEGKQLPENFFGPTLSNISVYLGMYHGWDTGTPMPEDIAKIVNRDEALLLAPLSHSRVNIIRSSDFVKTENYQQAECLVRNTFINRMGNIKHLFAQDIANYLTLAGERTVAISKSPLVTDSPLISLSSVFNMPSYRQFPVLTLICLNVIEKVENLRVDKSRFANHYAQFLSFVLLNYGLMNPCPMLEAQFRQNREMIHLREHLNWEQQYAINKNYQTFIDRYTNQNYHFKHRHLLQRSSCEPPSNEPFITPQPAPRFGYYPEDKLVQMRFSLFQTQRSANRQARELVRAVKTLAREYLDEKTEPVSPTRPAL